MFDNQTLVPSQDTVSSMRGSSREQLPIWSKRRMRIGTDCSPSQRRLPTKVTVRPSLTSMQRPQQHRKKFCSAKWPRPRPCWASSSDRPKSFGAHLDMARSRSNMAKSRKARRHDRVRRSTDQTTNLSIHPAVFVRLFVYKESPVCLGFYTF